jgi:cystathionine beta-lyase
MQFQAVDRHGTGSIKWDDTLRRLGSDAVLPLWVADMDFPAPQIVRDAMQKRLDHPVYGYTFFDEAFFDAIVWWYRERFGWEIEREWIVPDHGVVVSINTAIAALTQPGEGVLIQTPIYPPFMEAVRRNNRTLLENRLVLEEDRYRIDWDDFEAKASEASMFVLCSPHNPTTRVWRRDEIEQMAAICRRHDVIIVADEIHSDIVFEGAHVPIGSLDEVSSTTLTLHAPSKTFNVAGLNTSYAIIPDAALRNAYRDAFARAGLPHGNPFGIEALKAAYTPEGAAWLASLKRVLQANNEWVRAFLAEHLPQIRPVHTEGTFVMWLDCRALGLDDDRLNDLFVNRAHVGLNRGSSFGAAGAGFMRLNIGTESAIVREALERIRAAVEQL